MTRLTFKNNGKHHLIVRADNSTFGSMLLFGVYCISITESSFHIKSTQSHPIVEMRGGKLHMENCSFTGQTNLSAPAILKASLSNISMSNSTVESMTSPGGFVWVTNHSFIVLHQVTFKRNGDFLSQSAVAVTGHSSVETYNSVFEQNKADNGSCFYTGTYSNLWASGSRFKGNIAVGSGGVIYSESNTVLKLELCEFSNNSAWFNETWLFSDMVAGGGAIFSDENASLSLDRSKFFNNSCVNYENLKLDPAQNLSSAIHDVLDHLYAGDISTHQLHIHKKCQGGTLLATRANIQINSCTFKENYADYGGSVIAMGLNTNLTVNSTVFSNNSGNPNTGTLQCQNCGCTIDNSTFSQNIGVFVIWGKDRSNLTINRSQFYNNTGNNLIVCRNTNLRLDSTLFLDNGATNKKFTFAEILQPVGENRIYVFDRILYADSNSSVVVNFCNFTNNVMSSILSVWSQEEFTIASSTFQSNSASVMETFYAVNLTMKNCYMGNNSVFDGAVISCRDCHAVAMENSTFYHNDARDQAAVLRFRSKYPVEVTSTYCTFMTNKHGVFVGSHLNLTISSSSFIYNSSVFDDSLYNILDVTKSNVTLVNTSFDIFPVAYIEMNLKTFSRIIFINTIIKGFIVFVVQQSHFEMFNCSLLEESKTDVLSSEGQIQLKQKSNFHLQETIVCQGQYRFVKSEDASTISIVDCLFNFTSSTTQIDVENGDILLKNTSVYWEGILQVTPWSNTDYLINAVGSNMVIQQSNFNVFLKEYLLKFVSTNVTLDSSWFQTGQILFVEGANNFLLVNNITKLSGSTFVFHGGAQNVAINSSVFHMELESECQSFIETLRVYSSSLFINRKFKEVNKLLIWKSTVNIGNISLKTDSPSMSHKIKKSAVYDEEQCNQSMVTGPNNDSTHPLFAETRFAAGEFPTRYVVLLQYCLSGSLVLIQIHVSSLLSSV